MRKIIISMENCSKCKTLAEQCPDAEVVKAQPSELLQFARMVGIQSMPFVCFVGDISDLNKILK